MITKALKLSVPVAGALILMAAGLATSNATTPAAGAARLMLPQADNVVEIHHKKNKGHRGYKGGQRWGGQKWGGKGWDGPGRGHYSMGPRQIRRSLRHRGFHKIRIVNRRGPMYIVRAIGWRGMPVRLVVDSRTAHIVRSRPIGGGFYWQYSW